MSRSQRRLQQSCRNRILPVTLILQIVLITSAAFQHPRPIYTLAHHVAGSSNRDGTMQPTVLSASQESTSLQSSATEEPSKNESYINGLLENLSVILDKWIVSGSPSSKLRAYNLLKQIKRESRDLESVKKAERMIKRAGVPMEPLSVAQSAGKILGKTDGRVRPQEADQRMQWEKEREAASKPKGRSALSNRDVNSPLDPVTFANDKVALQESLEKGNNNDNNNAESTSTGKPDIPPEKLEAAHNRVSNLLAKNGVNANFDGANLGIGGLDEVLAQVKRRVWIPMAAPPALLEELGIQPVRGLLLYGRPGCGKTLIAKTIGQMLSPMRPVTVVAGPEIMDKFVGSSEKNLRGIFDSPPPIYDRYRIGESDNGESLERAALHVVVMDEFDAVARTRGGRGGKGEQGDAGVARDSVVNQLLAKLDGVDPLGVPTLVIGLTNKRSLIDPALLRPGRFEVQIEVPPPRTTEQRISILKVHTKSMYLAGRLLVRDAPPGSAAGRFIEKNGGMFSEIAMELPMYHELLTTLAEKSDGMSGASLAGVARAAASHALEVAVEGFSDSETSIVDCLVTEADFMAAIEDVLESMGDTDWEEEYCDPTLNYERRSDYTLM